METRKISEIDTSLCIRKDLGDLQGLAARIQRLGLLVPVTITPNNKLVFGLRRLRACELLGWKTIPVIVWEFSNG